MLDENQTRVTYADRKVDSLCPFCGVGCQVTYQVKDETVIYARAATGPPIHNRSASRAASASITFIIRIG